MTKLYDVPAGSKIIIPALNNQEVYKFFNIINMQVELRDKNENLITGIPPYADVIIVKE